MRLQRAATHKTHSISCVQEHLSFGMQSNNWHAINQERLSVGMRSIRARKPSLSPEPNGMWDGRRHLQCDSPLWGYARPIEEHPRPPLVTERNGQVCRIMHRERVTDDSAVLSKDGVASSGRLSGVACSEITTPMVSHRVCAALSVSGVRGVTSASRGSVDFAISSAPPFSSWSQTDTETRGG